MTRFEKIQRLNAALEEDGVIGTIARSLHIAAAQFVFDDMQGVAFQRLLYLAREPARFIFFQHLEHAAPDKAAAIVIKPVVLAAENGGVAAAAGEDECGVRQGGQDRKQLRLRKQGPPSSFMLSRRT